MEHPLQLDHVRAFDAREVAIAEASAGRVVDALHFGDRLRVLAHFDRERDEVSAAARIVRVGDLDRGRLQIAPALVAALRVARLERKDHPLGERHAAAFARFERRRDSVEHFRPDHDVGLRRIGLALPAAGPRVVLLAGVRRGPALHVDDPDLARLALLVAREQLRERIFRDRPPSRADPDRAVRTRPSSTPACRRRPRRRGRAAPPDRRTGRASSPRRRTDRSPDRSRTGRRSNTAAALRR